MPRTSSSSDNTSAKPRARTTRSARQQPHAAAERQAKRGNGAGPSYDEIAEAAYQRYLRRGGQHGRDFDDWLEAERELKERRQQ